MTLSEVILFIAFLWGCAAFVFWAGVFLAFLGRGRIRAFLADTWSFLRDVDDGRRV